MRLLTIQSQVVLDILNRDGIYTPVKAAGKLLKHYDKRYSRMVFFEGKDRPTSVVYCWASMDGSKCLSLYSFSRFINDLNGYYKSGLEQNDKVMFELEVQESDVLNVKDAHNWFQEVKPEYKEARAKSQYNKVKDEWLQVVDEDQIYTSMFKEHVRESVYDMEAVLPCIKKEWIVCYRTFRNAHNDHYGIHEVTTHVLRPDAFPLWTDTVYVAGGCRLLAPIVDNPVENEDYRTLSSEEGQQVIDTYSMDGCPRYYTIYEAMLACNAATKEKILKRCNEMSIPEDMFAKVPIITLFPDGLFPTR